MKEPIKFTLFHRFTISYQGECVTLTKSMGKQLVNLLELLVFYHQQALSNDMIIHTLWADNENPKNVMKFSVFRLRHYLKTIPFLANLNLIVTGKHGYMLNPNYPYEIDTEQLEQAYQIVKKEGVSQTTLKEAFTILNLYEGDIYTADRDGWTMQANARYRSIYQEILKKTCHYAYQTEAHDTIFEIACKATRLLPAFEEAHIWYLKALIHAGAYDKALKYYQQATTMLVRDYGSSISDKMRDVYRSIMMNNETPFQMHELRSQLQFALPHEHALFCEYDIFEYLYQNALQLKSRKHGSYFLALFHVMECAESDIPRAMNKLKQVISRNFHANDVFTKINQVQFAVLLQSKDEEGAHIIAQHVINEYHAKHHKVSKVGFAMVKI